MKDHAPKGTWGLVKVKGFFLRELGNSEKCVTDVLQFSATETFVPNAPALFAYAERAAVLGGAQLLVVLQSEDALSGCRGSIIIITWASKANCRTSYNLLAAFKSADSTFDQDPERNNWFAQRGFVKPSAHDAACSSQVLKMLS